MSDAAERGWFLTTARLRFGSWRDDDLPLALRGDAPGAAGAVIDRATAQGWRALIAGHHPGNHASRKTLLRLGFVATHGEYHPPSGVIEPCYRLDLSR